MITKKHTSQDGQVIIAICDKEILGKKFEETERQLDLTSNFYKGTELSEKEILELLPEAHSLNIVGKKSIAFAIKHKIIDEKHVEKIKGIPYAICIFESEQKAQTSNLHTI